MSNRNFLDITDSTLEGGKELTIEQKNEIIKEIMDSRFLLKRAAQAMEEARENFINASFNSSDYEALTSSVIDEIREHLEKYKR